jgi:hypothetical protein
MTSRTRTRFETGDEPGISEHKMGEILLYFNGGVEELNEKNAYLAREILEGEFKALGVQTECWLREFDVRRRACQTTRMLYDKSNVCISAN